MQEIKTKDDNQLFIQIKGVLDEARKPLNGQNMERVLSPIYPSV